MPRNFQIFGLANHRTKSNQIWTIQFFDILDPFILFILFGKKHLKINEFFRLNSLYRKSLPT